MLDRLPRPSLRSLSGAVGAARSALGSGVQGAGDLCASVSAKAVDALQRVERPSRDWLPDVSLSLPAWWPAFNGTPSAAPALLPAAASAAPTIEGWESAVGNTGLLWGDFFPKEGQDWSKQIDLDGLSVFLRAQHSEKTAQNVAARTKLPADTVKKWLLGVAAPNGRAMLVLACAYGPEVLVAMLRSPPGWLLEAARAAEQARLEAQLADLQAKLERTA